MMRKKTTLIVLMAAAIMSAALVSACGKDAPEMTLEGYRSEDKAYARAAEASWNESGVFSYRVSDDIKTIAIGCETYENGKLISDSEEFTAECTGRQGMIGLFFAGRKGTYSVAEEDSCASARVTTPWAKDKGYDSSGYSWQESQVTITKGEKTYLYAHYLQNGGEMTVSTCNPKDAAMEKGSKVFFFYAVFK